jgi:GABA permease
VKMWFFPALSILTLAGMLAVLVQMVFDDAARTQLWLSLLSWAVVLALYFVPRWRRGPAKPKFDGRPTGAAKRVLVLANEDPTDNELFDVVRRVDTQGRADYFICVPANPIDTGQAENTGPVYLWDATLEAAHRRLDTMLAALRSVGLHADGETGDERPMHALADAVERFRPDQLVIVEDRSTWLRLQLAKRVRSAYAIPVTQVLSGEPTVESVR